MGGRTLIIKLTLAPLRYAANGVVAELGKMLRELSSWMKVYKWNENLFI